MDLVSIKAYISIPHATGNKTSREQMKDEKLLLFHARLCCLCFALKLDSTFCWHLNIYYYNIMLHKFENRNPNRTFRIADLYYHRCGL